MSAFVLGDMGAVFALVDIGFAFSKDSRVHSSIAFNKGADFVQIFGPAAICCEGENYSDIILCHLLPDPAWAVCYYLIWTEKWNKEKHGAEDTAVPDMLRKERPELPKRMFQIYAERYDTDMRFSSGYGPEIEFLCAALESTTGDAREIYRKNSGQRTASHPGASGAKSVRCSSQNCG